MSQENKGKSSGAPALQIDYDNVDVARIMEEIRKKTRTDPRGDSQDFFKPSPGSSAYGSYKAGTQRREAEPGPRQRTRRILLKIMSPLSPLIKLLILPVYEEHRQMVMILDQANKRLDKGQEYIKLIHNLCHNLIVELTKLKIEVDLLKTKQQIIEKDFEFLGKRERTLEKEVFK